MDNFPVLTLVSKLLKLLGWIVVIGGIFVFLAGLSGLSGIRVGFLGGFGMSLLAGLAVAANGLVLVAAGEIIGVLFAIELNTRKAAKATQELNNRAMTAEARPVKA